MQSSNSENYAQSQEIEPEILIEISVAETYAYQRDFHHLERRLPELLEIARNLADLTRSELLLPGTAPDFEVPIKATILLNRLIAALHEYLTLSGRQNQLTRLTELSYLAALHADYATHFDDSAHRALELFHLAYLSPASKSSKVVLMEDWLKKLKDASDAGKEKLEAEILLCEALLARTNRNLPKARDQFKQAIQLYETQSNLFGQLNALIELAKLEELDDDGVEQARQYYNLALTKANTAGYTYYLAECYHRLGSMSLNDCEYALACEQFEKALNLCQQFNLKYLEAATLREMARTLGEQQNYEPALKLARQALTIEKILQTWREGATMLLIASLERDWQAQNQN